MKDEALQIAIVDDDPAVRDALGTIFELEGFRVRSYADGDRFLAEAQHDPTDCVLLDVHMPKRSGIEILEALSGFAYPAPIFIISGQGDIPMAVSAIKAGAHDFSRNRSTPTRSSLASGRPSRRGAGASRRCPVRGCAGTSRGSNP